LLPFRRLFSVKRSLPGIGTSSDTIHIAPGTYFENQVLDHDLTLTGTGGAAVTEIYGNLSNDVAVLVE
jgi:hypothetical protein